VPKNQYYKQQSTQNGTVIKPPDRWTESLRVVKCVNNKMKRETGTSARRIGWSERMIKPRLERPDERRINVADAIRLCRGRDRNAVWE